MNTLGPHLFVAKRHSDSKRRVFRVVVERETKDEQIGRQVAFSQDREYIEQNLVPGRPKYIKEVSNYSC